jgi:hypothetical protein
VQLQPQSATETVLVVASQSPRKKDKSEEDDKKVNVCHKPGTSAEKTLNIPMNAYENGHKGHGDTLGACETSSDDNQTGDDNTIVGDGSDNDNQTGDDNTIVGDGSDSTGNSDNGTATTSTLGNIKDMAYLPYAKKTFVLYDSGTVEVYVNGFDNPPIETIALPDVSNPQGMALGFGEDLYIADTGNHRILKLNANNGYTPDTQISPTGTFGSQGTGMAQFQSPEDVALGKINGRVVIFVADTGNNRIQRFSATGNFEEFFDGADSTAGVLNAPRSLTVSSGGGVAVVDGGNGRVIVFDTFGHFSRNFGSLNNPAKITQNFMTGDYIVADTGNSQVQIFRSNGDAQQEITELSVPPVAAVFHYGQLAEGLFIAPSTGDISLIKVVELSPDAQDATPVEIVRKFVAAIAAKDLQTAKDFLVEQKQATLGEYTQKPSELQALSKSAAAIVSLSLIKKRQNLSFVIGVTDTGKQVDFPLKWDPVSESWKISSF